MLPNRARHQSGGKDFICGRFLKISAQSRSQALLAHGRLVGKKAKKKKKKKEKGKNTGRDWPTAIVEQEDGNGPDSLWSHYLAFPCHMHLRFSALVYLGIVAGVGAADWREKSTLLFFRPTPSRVPSWEGWGAANEIVI